MKVEAEIEAKISYLMRGYRKSNGHFDADLLRHYYELRSNLLWRESLSQRALTASS